MRLTIKIFILSIVLINIGCASTMKKAKVYDAGYEKATILENGVKRIVRVQHTKTKLRTTSNIMVEDKNSKDGVIVSFKDDSNISLKDFELKYNLKFKTKLAIGYYIFENHSTRGDIEIVDSIIKNESNIKTVKPNWKMKNTIY